MSFFFRHQPLKALFLVGRSLYVIFAIPLWAITNALPSWRPRRSWSLKNALRVKLLRTGLKILFQVGIPEPPALDSFKREPNRVVWIERAAPDLIVSEIRDLAEKNGVKAVKVGGFWGGPVGSDGVVGQRASPEERVVYYFHGGAHVMGSSHPDGRVAAGSPFMPANPFPSSLLDAITGYRYLVEDVGFDPRRIILAGDSTGGGIAFNLAHYLAGQTCADDSHSAFVRNARSDIVQDVVENSYTRRSLLGKLPDEFAEKSLCISPGARFAEWKPGAFAGFPPTFIQAGDADSDLGRNAGGERQAT
ncbi:Alpha/Beta hydrolase protein [Trametes punicea]|nr:Alpha/Beta hydrolase protein [Trametes punicea]